MSSNDLSISKLRSSLIKLDRRGLLNKKEQGWSRRLFKWLADCSLYSDTEDFKIDPIEYINHLKTLSLSAHQSEVFYLCRVFQLSDYPVNDFELRSWKNVDPVVRERKVLPSTEVIRDNLSKLEMIEGLFLILLYVSGRRSIDLLRLESKNVNVVGNEVHIVLEFCKTKRHSTSYNFTILHDLEVNDLPYLQLFGHLLKNFVKPFEGFNVPKFASKLSFTPHTLRSCRAIHLVLEGLKMADVMLRIGWSSETTFKHYIRIPVTSIMRTKDFDTVVSQINSKL